jgi:uncharacterized protein YukE
MPAIGAEIEQLTSLQQCFGTQAANVGDLTTAIRSQLGGTTWQGPAAERFRDAWSEQFEPMLHKLNTALVEAGQEVSRRQQALIQAGS